MALIEAIMGTLMPTLNIFLTIAITLYTTIQNTSQNLGDIWGKYLSRRSVKVESLIFKFYLWFWNLQYCETLFVFWFYFLLNLNYTLF